MTLTKRVTQNMKKNQIMRFDFFERNRYFIWMIGLIIRLIVMPFGLKTRDFSVYRLPISIELAKGGGLYNQIHYNQMPIYPYITALAIIIVGSQNEMLTAIAIKLPLAVADSFIPVIIYKIGLRLDMYREGLLASIIYSLNPISILEVYFGRWDGFASLTVLIAFYLMLQNRPLLFGVMISIGFLLKEFPLFLFGIAFVYWKNDWKKIVKSLFSFFIFSSIIIALVLLPHDTSLSQMVHDLFSHPIYQERNTLQFGSLNCPNTFYGTAICFINNTDEKVRLILWGLIFMSLQLISLILYLINSNESTIIDVITLQITLLSIFFVRVHAQYILWMLPWLIFWEVKNGVKWPKYTAFLSLGYVGVKFGLDYSLGPVEFVGRIIIFSFGTKIVVQTLNNLFKFMREANQVNS